MKHKLNPLIWSPNEDRIKSSSMFRFKKQINKKYKINLIDFKDLHNWSINNREIFWEEVFDFFRIIGNKGNRPFIYPKNKLPDSKFFPNGKFNYAENMLRTKSDEIAIIFKSENMIRRTLTWKQLYEQVSAIANFFIQIGIKKGDRIAAYLPNMPETVVVMLATSSIGAIFSSASPDFGCQGVLDRFGQIEPKVLVVTDGYYYNGKEINLTDKVEEVVSGLTSIEKILYIPLINSDYFFNNSITTHYKYVTENYKNYKLKFEQVDFEHPLYIMYSSGTTGMPKCIVHSVGGVLLKHLVELGLHSNFKENDKVFYFTTCGWMMWNWLVSGLLLGSTICLYDGSPFYPNANILWDFADEEEISFFGTSAKYIDALSKEKISIIDTHDLTNLETIGSTGSPLVHESFDYIYDNIKKDVQLASLSGGTDIVGCFVGGNPLSSVYRGEIQGPILGMDVNVFNDTGKKIVNEKGELVCLKSFPTMPIMFWNDAEGKKYHDAYFNKFSGVWCHGDYILETPNKGYIIYGRSDATLNPGGVRIGTAEIYRQVEQVDDVLEGLVIGQEWKSDIRVILFVRLNENIKLSFDLENKIKKKIREGASPRHVPAKIISVNDIPRTKSGKIAELAVRDLIHGKSVKNINALANPECLKNFSDLLELKS